MAKKRTISDVEDRISDWISEAGRTLKYDRMPKEVLALSRRVGAWPDMIHDPAEAFGWDKVKSRPVAPAPDAIDRLDVVLGWLLKVPAEYRPIMAARMHGYSFGKIAIVDPRSRSSEALRKAYWAGVHYIFLHLWEEGTKSCDGGLPKLSKSG